MNFFVLFQLFGTSLAELSSPNNPIPEAIVKLMREIEKRGRNAFCLLFKNRSQK